MDRDACELRHALEQPLELQFERGEDARERGRLDDVDDPEGVAEVGLLLNREVPISVRGRCTVAQWGGRDRRGGRS